MAGINLQLCTPQPTYLIIEEIHRIPLPGLDGLGALVSPGGHKVYRRVAQVCDVQDIFFDNERVEGMPTTWQYLKDFIDSRDRITTRPTGARELTLAFAGDRTMVQFPSVSQFDMPEWWKKEYDVTLPSPFTYGTDPIPHVALYNNPAAMFVMPGGKGPATAIGILRSGSSQVEFPSVPERAEAVRNLRMR